MRRAPTGPATFDSARRGFTLTEVMVAIAVLLIVIVATGKIFGTAGQVTGIGRATADVLAEAAAFERRIREDLSRLSTDGFFAIRNVALPNDINLPGPLLDPRRPNDAVIRADQLVFFTTGVTTTQVYAEGEPYADRSQQALATRVYYGHGFQVPELRGCADPQLLTQQPNPYLPWYAGNMVPWYFGPVPWRDPFACGPPPFTGTVQHAPIPAAQWPLARQEVLIADDGGSYERYLLNIGNNSAENAVEWLHDDLIRNSRRDIAGRQLHDIKCNVWTANLPDPKRCACADLRQGTGGCNTIASWDAQRDFIEQYHLFYPRAERFTPDMPREDVGLTTNVISAACSSIEIEWTIGPGRDRFFVGGEQLSTDGIDTDGDGDPDYYAQIAASGREQPWFGLSGQLMDDPNNEVGLEDGTRTFGAWQSSFGLDPMLAAIFPVNIERFDNIFPLQDVTAPVVYTAIFGYNRAQAVDPEPSSGTFGEPVLEPFPGQPFTPWPSAIRVTLTLHDPENRLASGRRFQFVVDLPRRVVEE
ncbi:MAG: PulJ/GspJ family protein [Planctomycetota bacterium]|jgi:prepilin-type N-terminal cleavage/methylation domain-containing protein